MPTSPLGHRPPPDEPDRWDRLSAQERRARPPVSERQRAWAATRGGPRLAALLADVDPGSLDPSDTVAFARAVQRQQSWTDSLLLRATKRFAEHRPGPDRTQESLAAGSEKRLGLGGEGCPGIGSFAVAEWAVALRITRTAAHRLIGDALDLSHRLQGIAMAARIGHTDTARARMVAEATRDLPPELAADLEEVLIPVIGTLTRRRLQQLIDRLLAVRAPHLRRRRAEQVKARREVFIEHTDDDHAEISGTLDAVAARLLDRRLDVVAGQLRRVQATLGETAGFGPAGETRDQRRARALGLLAEPGRLAVLQRLLAGSPGAASATSGAAGADSAGVDTDAAAARPVTLYLHRRAGGSIDLEGHGTLTPETARDLLAGARVTVRPVIDCNTRIVSTGYRPSRALREQTLLTQDTCFFPDCDAAARGGDFEHTIPAPRGPTATGNAGQACRHHHRVKTHGEWEVRQPFPGVHVWRAPTGEVYAVDDHGTHRVTLAG